ncbi:hypothetical protein CALCODRAFT_83781 [Calocera cornea HHB12733]|uniref:Uncharacterized protein n=1 Tax=Calocera cornea HHB12733 TaxID=1353952 RepID=A0A165ILK2_9BASI|nr:hypothetical protein CALCODRAFT_83781 [Calocera cornea HHB12733]
MLEKGREHVPERARQRHAVGHKFKTEPLLTQYRWPENARTYRLLPEQIYELLQRSVLDELAAIKDNLQSTRAPYSPVVRRLTRDELQALREGSGVSLPGASAVIMATRINPRNRVLKQTEPSTHQDGATLPPVELPSLSLPPSTIAYTMPDLGIPRPPIPIYNSLVLFPEVEKRQELMSLLANIIQAERSAERMAAASRRMARSSSKASHGYLINLDAASTRRASTTNLLIALWRMRLYHGQGWTTDGDVSPPTEASSEDTVARTKETTMMQDDD